MNSLFLLTQNTNAIFGPIARLLGFLMNGIYILFDNLFNIQNIALTIIVFTIIIYICMLPLTYQQQKFAKMTQIMNPEIKAVQKKYKNRRDSASVQAMNAETQEVYKKYGVRPSGSCVFVVIQFLILIPLYRVIYNVPAYVTRVKDSFEDLVDSIMGTSDYQNQMTDFFSEIKENNSVFRSIDLNFSGTTAEAHDSIIDVLYKCTSSNWHHLSDFFPDLSGLISSTQANIEHFNSFLGVSIVYSPRTLISTGSHEGQYLMVFVAILIPVISAGSQFLSVRLSSQQQPSSVGGQGDQMANQMRMMTYFMPIYSFFIVFFLPIGVGIYWIAGAVIRIVQQLVINRHFDHIDMAALVEKNKKKAEAKQKAKAEKQGVPGSMIANAAKVNARQIDAPRKKSMSEKAAAVSNKSSGNRNSGSNYKKPGNNTQKTGSNSKKQYKEGSMAALANKVKEYNEKNSK